MRQEITAQSIKNPCNRSRRACANKRLGGEPSANHTSKIYKRKIKNKPKAVDSEKNISDFFAEEWASSISMVGRSKATLHKLKMIKLVAASRCNPVLVVGETGTGKELAAKAIHLLRHPGT